MARGGSEEATIDFDDLVRTGLGVTVPLTVASISVSEELHSWNEMTLRDLFSLTTAADRSDAPLVEELLSLITDSRQVRLDQVGREEITAYGFPVEFRRAHSKAAYQLAEWLRAADEPNRDQGLITWLTMAAEDYDVLAWKIESEFAESK